MNGSLLITVGEYLKNNPALIAVIAVIAAFVVALIVLLIATEVKKRKKTAPKEEQAETGGSAPLDEDRGQPQEKEEQPQEEQAPKEEQQEPAPQENQETAEEDERKKERTAKKLETLEKPAAKPTPAPVKPKKDGAVGKWILYEENRGGYGFRLLASNGEIMLKSSSPYASQQSAKAGIKTYQDNIAAGRLEIVETKSGSFFVQVNNANNRLLATSADYKTRASCESAAESIKRWAATTVIATESEPDKN